MGCNQSKQTPDAPPPKSTGNKLNASRRDSVAVTKARMEKNKDKVPVQPVQAGKKTYGFAKPNYPTT